MKTTARILAALLIVTLLAGMTPISLADASSLAGSHWYAHQINCEFMDEYQIDSDMQMFLDLLGYMVKFVPYERNLWNFSVLSFYCGIDFHANGTFDLTMACSSWGEVDPDSVTRVRGEWYCFGNTLIMEVDGVYLPLEYRNSVLSLSFFGIGLDFTRTRG